MFLEILLAANIYIDMSFCPYSTSSCCNVVVVVVVVMLTALMKNSTSFFGLIIAPPLNLLGYVLLVLITLLKLPLRKDRMTQKSQGILHRQTNNLLKAVGKQY